MSTTYAPDQFRKILKSEKAEFIQAALERAKDALPQHEGSRNPSGRTTFYVASIPEAMIRWAELSADGWVLDSNSPILEIGYQIPLAFTAIAPSHVFETYLPLIAERAEYDYEREVEAHNKQAQKLKERTEFIESEFIRREEERKAKALAELAAEFDNRGRVQFITESDTQLHTR
ncbi:hypothetical protein [Pseudomonas syringae group genomosp. 7]|uniref:hypothetical protein n=1 Tax=Pseudomonas TaxID=286 RepID=UPI000EFE7585|nr:hypothetical protein [Pseudomonas syringae group genomosp. 7]RMR03482.1 hypothetical protein ALP93_00001 [Pseudomonas syringae pv. helianthi]